MLKVDVPTATGAEERWRKKIYIYQTLYIQIRLTLTFYKKDKLPHIYLITTCF